MPLVLLEVDRLDGMVVMERLVRWDAGHLLYRLGSTCSQAQSLEHRPVEDFLNTTVRINNNNNNHYLRADFLVNSLLKLLVVHDGSHLVKARTEFDFLNWLCLTKMQNKKRIERKA